MLRVKPRGMTRHLESHCFLGPFEGLPHPHPHANDDDLGVDLLPKWEPRV